MRAGNDVVDLKDPANQPSSIHPRFDRRVFDPREIRLLDDASNEDARHRLRWTLWAAKEAALKALRQARPDRPFHPTELGVHLDSAGAGRVRSGGESLLARLDVTEERVHAIVSDRPLDLGGDGVFVLVERRAANADEAVGAASLRRRCAAELARRLGIPEDRVDVCAGGAGGAPVARSDGRDLDAALSFSHDGRWDAAVVVSRPASPA